MWTIIGLIIKNPEISLSSRNNPEMSQRSSDLPMLANFSIYMSYFAYACKTEWQNGISRLISELLRTLNSSLRDHLFMLQNEVFWTT